MSRTFNTMPEEIQWKNKGVPDIEVYRDERGYIFKLWRSIPLGGNHSHYNRRAVPYKRAFRRLCNYTLQKVVTGAMEPDLVELPTPPLPYLD